MENKLDKPLVWRRMKGRLVQNAVLQAIFFCCYDFWTHCSRIIIIPCHHAGDRLARW
ncbi:hypothetical protein GS8_2167 [Geobacillus stearothermophilus]|uniref:Uncharacterized protein n=1 Tax=Geobacillus stearothermophilus TaxID=1422 RepID=A0ABQ7HCU8_GEOSE|nr:hypothetical protein GS8_2167 [Geobacillus stearothermophilus]